MTWRLSHCMTTSTSPRKSVLLARQKEIYTSGWGGGRCGVWSPLLGAVCLPTVMQDSQSWSWMMSTVLKAKEDAKGPVRTFCSQTKHIILERPVTLVYLLLETTRYYWTVEWECCAVRYSVMLPTKKSQVRETRWRKHTWSMSLGMVLSCVLWKCSLFHHCCCRYQIRRILLSDRTASLCCSLSWLDKVEGDTIFFSPSVTARAGGGETLTKHSVTEITGAHKRNNQPKNWYRLISLLFAFPCVRWRC